MPTPPNSSTAADLESSELTLLERYHVLMDRVAAAAERSGRSAKDIIVVLVSKYGTLE